MTPEDAPDTPEVSRETSAQPKPETGQKRPAANLGGRSGRGRRNRKTFAIEARRRRVAELAAAGYDVREITETLAQLNANAGADGPIYSGISKSNVERDIQYLEERWAAEALEAIDSRKARHVAQIEADIAYWRRQVLLVGSGRRGAVDAEAQQQDLETRSRLYRDHVRPLMRDLADLLGLKAPTKIDISETVKRWAREEGWDESRAVELAREVVAGVWEAE